MSFAQKLVELRPSIRWHVGATMSRTLYRQAFAGLGADSVIVKPRILRGVERIHIGRGCAFYAGAWLQCEPGNGRLTIGDDNYFGHDAHLHAYDSITIGSRCVFADAVFIGAADHARGDRHATAGSGPIRIGDDVFLGQGVVVLGGVTIGDRATVGAGAVVTKDIPAGAVAGGVPARIIADIGN